MKTIEELEKESGEAFENVVSDYVDSCLRTEHYDVSDCTDYFMRENNIDDAEYHRVYEAIEAEFNRR